MKNVFKVIIFLLILLFLLFVASYLFVPKSNITKFGFKNAKESAVLSEKENTIDALFVGDSLIYTSVSPMRIWSSYGITSFDLSSSAQYLYESYNFLKSALETQNPKYVLLEANGFFRKYKLINVIGAEGKRILPVFEYHNRWKSLKKEDFIIKKDYNNEDINKGYRFMDKINSASNVHKDYMHKRDDTREIPSLNYRYIKKIIDLCKENNIKLILLSTPSMTSCNDAKYKAIKNIAREFSLEHIDLNKDVNLEIDWSVDTQDKGDHLNYLGAIKVSDYLGSVLKEKGLEDHRKDPKYASWNETLIKYNKQFKDKK